MTRHVWDVERSRTVDVDRCWGRVVPSRWHVEAVDRETGETVLVAACDTEDAARGYVARVFR